MLLGQDGTDEAHDGVSVREDAHDVGAAIGPARDEARMQAVTHAREAIRLGASDSTALANAGFMLAIADKDIGGARAALDTAVALNPISATAFTYRALVLAIAGEPLSAIDDASCALRLSPLDPLSHLPRMAILIARLWRPEYDDAVAAGHKAIELAPRYPMGYAWVIVAECERGNAASSGRRDGSPTSCRTSRRRSSPSSSRYSPTP